MCFIGYVVKTEMNHTSLEWTRIARTDPFTIIPSIRFYPSSKAICETTTFTRHSAIEQQENAIDHCNDERRRCQAITKYQNAVAYSVRSVLGSIKPIHHIVLRSKNAFLNVLSDSQVSS